MPRLTQMLALLIPGILIAGPAAAQGAAVNWLPDGAEFTLSCSGSTSGERSWKVGSRDGEARLERVGRDQSMQAPAWALLFTDIANEFENGSPTKRMRQVGGQKDGLTRLEPGAGLSVEYEWARGNQSANRTHTVKVEEKKTVKTEAFGEQEIYVVTDTVTGRIHNMKPSRTTRQRSGPTSTAASEFQQSGPLRVQSRESEAFLNGSRGSPDP